MTDAQLNLKVDNSRLLQAFKRSPKALEKNLSSAISRIIQNIARTAKIDAPKAHSTLAQSIHTRRINALHGEVRTGTNYGGAVEQGTGIYGPEGKSSGKMPPLFDIMQWIRVKRIQPRDDQHDIRDLAFIIARSISKSGTPAQPFLIPAAERNQPDARRRVSRAIDLVLEDI